MRIVCTTQRTKEWHLARAGRLTASSISKILAGKLTKGRAEYILSLCWDLEGVENFDIEQPAPWFVDGVFFEKYARGWYEWNRDLDVRPFGFVVHDDFDWLGCSPDGGVDPDGGIEVKFRKTLKSFRDHYNQPISRPAYAQMQCQMWIMGWQWIDYINYWRDEAHELEQGKITRVLRDPSFIEKELHEQCLIGWRDVLRKYHQRNGDKPFAIDLQIAA